MSINDASVLHIMLEADATIPQLRKQVGFRLVISTTNIIQFNAKSWQVVCVVQDQTY